MTELEKADQYELIAKIIRENLPWQVQSYDGVFVDPGPGKDRIHVYASSRRIRVTPEQEVRP